MENPAGESSDGALSLDLDRRLKLDPHGSRITSDARLLAYRELDDAWGLSAMADGDLADARTGRNGRHPLVGKLRQSMFGRLARYDDVNDAERLRHDSAMRWIVGRKAARSSAASPRQMGRFETRWLTAVKNLSVLSDLSGQCMDRVQARRLPSRIVLDMDSSVNPTHGEQEMSVLNSHFECTCYHPLFVFNQFHNMRGNCEQWIKDAKGAINWTRLSCRSFPANVVRPRLLALACNLGNVLLTLATPEPIRDWSLTSLKETLIKIGANVISHGRYPAFQKVEVASPRQLFADILRLIAELRPRPDPSPT